jgi:PAS domain-containing protein
MAQLLSSACGLEPGDFGIGQLFAVAGDAVVVGDVGNGRVVLWNPAAEAMFGYSPDAWLAHAKGRHTGSRAVVAGEGTRSTSLVAQPAFGATSTRCSRRALWDTVRGE